MTYIQVVRHFGSLTAAAQALGLPLSTVSDWRDEGVPYGRQCEIQLRTDGALKANPQPKAVAA